MNDGLPRRQLRANAAGGSGSLALASLLRAGRPTHLAARAKRVMLGLGSGNDDLPSFVVLCDPRGLPPGGMIVRDSHA